MRYVASDAVSPTALRTIDPQVIYLPEPCKTPTSTPNKTPRAQQPNPTPITKLSSSSCRIIPHPAHPPAPHPKPPALDHTIPHSRPMRHRLQHPTLPRPLPNIPPTDITHVHRTRIPPRTGYIPRPLATHAEHARRIARAVFPREEGARRGLADLYRLDLETALIHR